VIESSRRRINAAFSLDSIVRRFDGLQNDNPGKTSMKAAISKGFTFIEVVTVVAILGIISALVLAAINPGRRVASARDADRVTGVKQIKTAIDSYQALHNYPPSCDGQTSCPMDFEITGTDFLSTILKNGDFLKTVPPSPATPSAGICKYHAYLYLKSQNKYWLSFCLEGWSKSQVESLPDNDGIGGGSPEGTGRYWCYFSDADGVAVCWVGIQYEIPPL